MHRGLRADITQVLAELSSRKTFFRRQASQFGTQGALKLRLIHKYNRIAARFRLRPFWPVIRLRLPEFDLSLYLRTGTSDPAVLVQIFTEREYAPLDNLGPVRTIIDCGANVGYSSIYFLNRYPLAHVIAVEPDPRNAALCRRNLAPYGNRVQVIQSAVWSHPARLALVRAEQALGQEWATQVREVNPGESASADDLIAVDMPYLLSLCAGGRADILKIDIEHSEKTVFRDAARWLHLVDNVAIELHDASCETAFFASLQDFQYDFVRSGELTICRTLRASAPAEAANDKVAAPESARGR
jgi:FkbM family methyltransferase